MNDFTTSMTKAAIIIIKTTPLATNNPPSGTPLALREFPAIQSKNFLLFLNACASGTKLAYN